MSRLGKKPIPAPNGVTVTYDVNVATAIDSVGIHGVLTFSTDATTKLRVENLLVYEDGALRVGTDAAPSNATYFSDGVHPTAAGNQLLAPYVTRAIQSLIVTSAGRNL